MFAYRLFIFVKIIVKLLLLVLISCRLLFLVLTAKFLTSVPTNSMGCGYGLCYVLQR